VSNSEAFTRAIRVSVQSQLSPGHSEPKKRQWFFVYTVTIANEGSATVQLLNRHWTITDANGAVQEVRGEGVIGRQPVLAPGESFEYTSGAPLPTPFGSMHGRYEMRTDSGERFWATVAPFALREEGAFH